MRSSNLEDKNCKHTRQLAHSRLELQYNFCSQSKLSPAVGLELTMLSVLCKWTRSFFILQLFLVSWNIGDDVSTDQESEPRRMFAWSDACVFNLERKVFESPPKKNFKNEIKIIVIFIFNHRLVCSAYKLLVFCFLLLFTLFHSFNCLMNEGS